jgi:NADH:ubiquinone oxidoreductase subunit C
MTTELETRLLELARNAKITHATDDLWLDAPELDVTRMAVVLRDLGARLSTMTGIALDDGETELIYHYVVGKTALNLKVRTRGNSMASITPLVPAANWIEREIHDLYAVEFPGHPNLERFIRPAELPAGLFREPGGAAGKRLREQAGKI